MVRKLGERDTAMEDSNKRSYCVTRFNQLEEQYGGELDDVPFFNRKECNMVDIDVSDFDVLVRDEVLIDIYSEELKIASCTFHTAFVDNCYLEFDKDQLDILCGDTHNHFCSSNTKIALLFAPTVDKPELNIVDPAVQSEGDKGSVANSSFNLLDTSGLSTHHVAFDNLDMKSGVSELDPSTDAHGQR